MFYKLIKKLFEIFINVLQFVRVALIFLSFFIILYWFLQVIGATFIQPVSPFFESIKSFIHIFYSRIVQMDKVTIDFSFLLATILVLLISMGVKSIINFVESAKEKFELLHISLKRKSEEKFNIRLEKQYVNEENKNNKFLMLINFSVIDLNKDHFFTKDVDEGIEEKQRKILEDFFETLEGNLECKEKFIKDGLLLYFDDFDCIENVLFHTENIIKSLKNKYEQKNWRVSSVVSIDSYADEKETVIKTEKLKILNKLEFKNKIACLATFKQRYSLMKNPQYAFEDQGLYKIKTDEEVFYLKKI